MQFMPETARRYGLQNPHDPKAAIDAAAHYLRDLLIRFDGRLDLALAAYNAGEDRVARHADAGRWHIEAHSSAIDLANRISASASVAAW